MTEDLPIPATASHVPTVEQQERIAAAIRAAGLVVLGETIDEDTARLIALPVDQIGNPEAVMRAAFATKMRNSHIWNARARGVAMDANGKEIEQ